MCKLLVSVRSTDEALLAQANGADFIDLKEPRDGALGAIPVAKAAEIISILDAKTVTSATIGDLPMEASLIAQAIEARLNLGVDYLKVGFFPATRAQYDACIRVLNAYAKQAVNIIAVLFADLGYSTELVASLKASGIAGIMLDTAKKDGQRLRDHCTEPMLNEMATTLKSTDLLFGLAGSLRLSDIQPLKVLAPDYLGFRSGACEQSLREGPLSAVQIRKISKLL